MRKLVTNSCSVCREERKSRVREFSPQAWTALSQWGEVIHHSLYQPICESCYKDLRDLLIERADELVQISEQSLAGIAEIHEIPSFRAPELARAHAS